MHALSIAIHRPNQVSMYSYLCCFFFFCVLSCFALSLSPFLTLRSYIQFTLNIGRSYVCAIFRWSFYSLLECVVDRILLVAISFQLIYSESLGNAEYFVKCVFHVVYKISPSSNIVCECHYSELHIRSDHRVNIEWWLVNRIIKWMYVYAPIKTSFTYVYLYKPNTIFMQCR